MSEQIFRSLLGKQIWVPDFIKEPYFVFSQLNLLIFLKLQIVENSKFMVVL